MRRCSYRFPFSFTLFSAHALTSVAMPLHVQSPQPTRSLKRSLESIDTNRPSVSKHPRLGPLPLPSPAPSVDSHLFPDAQRPSICASSALSQPTPKRKRALEDSGSNCVSSKKHPRLHSPTPFFAPSVRQWLSQVPRPDTPPPGLLSTEISTPIVELVDRPSSAPARIEMSQQNGQRPPSAASTSNTRPSTSDSLYRSLIHRNNIILDPAGRRIEKEIQELLDIYILKGRDSPPLTDAEVFDVVDTAVDLLDCAEGKAADLIETKAIPLKRGGIAEGRNVQWSTDALPSNPKYPHQLSAPKPDRHYGYPLGHKSDWTDEEMAVVDHRTAQPYTQPTRENLFPFLTLEIKSEATVGVLYFAENQAVGSGVHSVESLRWLLTQAFPSKVPTATDAVAFTGAVSPRAAVFYILWYSQSEHRYIMSKFSNVSFMEGPKRPDIQECKNVIKNVLDYGLDVRQPVIKKALAQLDPVPRHWKKSRSASALTETPPTSFGTDETRSNKSRKR